MRAAGYKNLLLRGKAEIAAQPRLLLERDGRNLQIEFDIAAHQHALLRRADINNALGIFCRLHAQPAYLRQHLLKEKAEQLIIPK